MSTLSVIFGALAPDLTEQLRPLGLSLPDGDAERFQFYVDAVVRLMIAGLVTDSEVRRIRERIMKQLAQKVAPA